MRFVLGVKYSPTKVLENFELNSVVKSPVSGTWL